MATQINIPIDDNQTAPQVPFTPIIADATHVAVNATHVQAALLILAEYAKDRPTLGTMNTALANYANAFNASQTAQDAIIATKLNDAQNGLTKVGDKVELGGILYKVTLVNQNGFPMLFSDGNFGINTSVPLYSLDIAENTADGTINIHNDLFQNDGKYLIRGQRSDNTWVCGLKTGSINSGSALRLFVGNGFNSDVEMIRVRTSGVAIGNGGFQATETLDVNGNVKGNTAKFFSYVTLSDPQTKNIQSKVSAEQARLFIELFPDAIVYSHKDEYVPEEMKGKMFIGFDAREVEKVQKANTNIFVPLTTQTQIDEFDKDSTQWDSINNAVFEPNHEQLEDEESLKQAKATWEVQKEAQRQGYEKQKASHEVYREQYDKVLYLDQSSILPMVLMEMKRLNKRVAALEKPKPKRVYKKKAK